MKAVGLSSFSTGVALMEKIDKDRSLGPLEELGCEVQIWTKSQNQSYNILKSYSYNLLSKDPTYCSHYSQNIL